MLTLSELLYLICQRTNIHVCIHDVSGILEQETLKIDSFFKRHSKPFCDAAKSTEKGYNTCIACKDASNHRAALGEDFSRHCPFGIYEIIRPVNIGGKIRCIIYLGNLTTSPAELREYVMHACKSTGVLQNTIEPHINATELIRDENYYSRLADFIRDFIINLYTYDSAEKSTHDSHHWCVKRAIEYVQENYSQNMTLSSLASLYFINEKYLGRIFKKHTGKTFHEYITDIRLEKAIHKLSIGTSIASIANDCGFQNVTYFNRCFKKKYGISPTQYRKAQK